MTQRQRTWLAVLADGSPGYGTRSFPGPRIYDVTGDPDTQAWAARMISLGDKQLVLLSSAEEPAFTLNRPPPGEPFRLSHVQFDGTIKLATPTVIDSLAEDDARETSAVCRICGESFEGNRSALRLHLTYDHDERARELLPLIDRQLVDPPTDPEPPAGEPALTDA